MLSKFRDFLRVCIERGGSFKKGKYHAVFSHGTVVRFDPSNEEIKDFGDFDFPMSRIQCKEEDFEATYNKIVLENNQHYKKVLEFKTDEPDWTRLVNTAFSILMNDGYPYPCGAETESVTLAISEDNLFWGTQFPIRNRHITTYTVSPTDSVRKFDKKDADTSGKEARRLDYMFPRLIAIINPELKVTDI